MLLPKWCRIYCPCWHFAKHLALWPDAKIHSSKISLVAWRSDNALCRI